MTLIVEDGTGLSNANSYASVSDADAYFAARSHPNWVGSTAAKEAALLKATQYLDTKYLWRGTIFSSEQSLNIPRSNFYDVNGRDLSEKVPTVVKNATCELALIALTETLSPTVSTDNYVKSKKVGELEIVYRDGAVVKKQFSFVDELLYGLYQGKTGSGQGTVYR